MKQLRFNRRNFLTTSAKGTVAAGIAASSLGAFLQSCSSTKGIMTMPAGMQTGFAQSPLPYSYSALENIIDAQTMEIHYSKHAAGYSKNLTEAAAAEGVAAGTSVETILANIGKYSTKMRNNAGGHYNHEMFWKCMRPKTANNKPTGSLLTAIENKFSSFDAFTKQFSDAAATRFGSGWAWLYVAKDKSLMVGSTPNQDNPLMPGSDVKGFPLLGIDVWEHAYYLKYQNKRADYIRNWWDLVNWQYVQQRFDAISAV